MSIRRVVLLLLTGWVLSVPAWETPPPAEIIRQLGEYAGKCRAYQAKLDAATEVARTKDREAQWRRSALDEKLSDQQLADLQRQLASSQERYDLVLGELTCAKIADADARAAKLKEAETELGELREAAKVAGAPFAQERNRLREAERPLNQDLLERVGKVGRTPEEWSVVKVTPSAAVGWGTVGLRWADASDKPVAYFSLHLSATNSRPSTEPKEKLWDRFPVLSTSDSSLAFKVGEMVASLTVSKADWRGKETVRKLCEALFDPASLEEFRAGLEDNKEFRQQITEAGRLHLDLESRAREAGKESTARSTALQQELRELNQPYDPARVAGLEKRLASSNETLLGIRIRLDAAALQDPEERKVAKEKAEEEMKKAREGVAEAGLALKGEQRALRNAELYLNLSVRVMLDGVERIPEGVGLYDAGVGVNAQDGSVFVRWSDRHDQQVLRAVLRFRPASPPSADQPLIAGKYPVLSSRFDTLYFQVGGVMVELRAEVDDTWKNKEKLLGIADKLLDLDRLAALPTVEPGK